MNKHYFITVLISMVLIAACGNKGTGNNGDTPSIDDFSFNYAIKSKANTSEKKGYSIECTVAGQSGGHGKLIGVFGKQNFLVDSVAISNAGYMKFTEQSNPNADSIVAGMYFILLPSQDFIQILVTDLDRHFSLKTSTNDLIRDMQVSNSITNELLYTNLKYQADLDQKFAEVNNAIEKNAAGSEEKTKAETEKQSLLVERDAHVQWFAKNYPDNFFTKFKLAGQNPTLKEPKLANGEIDTIKQVYLYRNEFWDGVDFSDGRLMRTPVIHNKIEKFIGQLTDQRVDSLIKYADFVTEKAKADKEIFKYIVNFIALKYQPKKTTLMGGEAVYVNMIDKYFTQELAFWSNPTEINGLRREANEMKPSLLGKTGQDVTATDVNGKSVSLYDFKTPISVVFIYSATCEHCQEAAPEMQALYKEWQPKGVEFYGICTDAEEAEWKKFVQKYGLTFTNVIDPSYDSNYYKKYHIDITPEIYVLDNKNNHKIVAKNLKPNQMPQFFEKILNGE